MKLYSKKISSLAELEKEKRRLIKEKKRLEKEDFFSIDELVQGVGDIDFGGLKSSAIGSILSGFLPLSGSIVTPVAEMAMSWFANRNNNKSREENSEKSTSSKAKKILFSVGKDVLVSYLKWKAVELSYKGVKLIIKKKKQKRKATSE